MTACVFFVSGPIFVESAPAINDGQLTGSDQLNQFTPVGFAGAGDDGQ
jgi:hypothetical protein